MTNTMTGSEKQIAWAEDIKADLIHRAEVVANRYTEKEIARFEARPELFATQLAAHRARVAAVPSIIAAVEGVTDAGLIITFRNAGAVVVIFNAYGKSLAVLGDHADAAGQYFL